jgi:hypothetical protein
MQIPMRYLTVGEHSIKFAAMCFAMPFAIAIAEYANGVKIEKVDSDDEDSDMLVSYTIPAKVGDLIS